jgi:replicative DNA helicase
MTTLKNTGNSKKDWKNYQGEDQVVTSHAMRASLGNKTESLVNARSLIPSLDKAVDGFRDGELVVISGPTKNGKTLLAQTLTANFAKNQIFSLWFSFEVPARQFLSQFQTLPLIYMPKRLQPKALTWFKDRVFESFEKFHTRIIFIDHLHYLVDLARQKHLSIEIGTVIRELKTLAVQNDFVIFLLCHTGKSKIDDGLSYESIRDSSFISQESDSVIMIKRRPDVADNAATMRVEFHRRTGIMEREINLIKIDGYLQEEAQHL